MPATAWNYWNLIKFNEHQRDDGNLMWLMRKDQCMHCEDPGCLRACPADGAIVQYTNGIVDFQQENCIGCQYCVSGCPFDIPKFNSQTKKVYKCTLCSDRVGQGLEPACIKACPTGCLQVRHEGRHGSAGRSARAASCASSSGYANAGVYDPPSVGGTHVIYVLHDITKPELYGGLPKNPQIPRHLYALEADRQTDRARADAARRAAGVLPLHHGRAQRRAAAIAGTGGAAMSTAIERFDEGARRRIGARGRTFVREQASCCGIPFTPECSTGVSRRSSSWRCCRDSRFTAPGSFTGVTPVFGGGPTTRLLHPWFSLGFVACFALQFLNWLRADDVDCRRSPVDASYPRATSATQRRSSPSTSTSSTPGRSCTSGRSSAAPSCF